VVFYAERVDDNGILHNVNVFVDRPQDQPKPKAEPAQPGAAPSAPGPALTPPTSNAAAEPAAPVPPKADPGNKLEIWVASRAEQRGVGQAEQTFVLYDGYRYEGTPGGGEFRIIRFSEGGIPIPLGSFAGARQKAGMKTTAELLASSQREDIAELQWRIATPVSALILMLMAVPLARLRPRQGRFGKIGIAILVYFLYSRLMVSGKTWIETDTVPAWTGLWWVHGVALAAAIWMLMRQNPPGRAKLIEARSGEALT
jgi:lipopolysaccharide export system permease protein